MPPDPAGGRRYITLDALRGIAAATVVLLHFHDMWRPSVPDNWRLAIHIITFLSPLYAGHQAVILFFILSGFVLTLPYLRGRQQPYPHFLLRRVIRIYLPYWAALLLAVVGAASWHARQFHIPWSDSSWSTSPDWHLIAQHLFLIGSFNTREFDFVVWSLVHEMRVSIIFPFLCIAVIRAGWKPSLAASVLVSIVALYWRFKVSATWTSYIETAHYIAFFVIGICLAAELPRLERWWQKRGRRFFPLIASISAVCYGYTFLLVLRGGPFLQRHHVFTHRNFSLDSSAVWGAIDWCAAVGATGFLLMALFAQPVKRFLSLSASRFLGAISYSLYLIHPIVLLAITFSALGRTPILLQFPLYLCAAVSAGWLLWWLIERNSIALSRRA